ncbi:MAG: hypothetical protein IPM46_06345 [Flavobacteriales bacterium]|nr:hypothetical protein [Flavobacteriales bacterium]
MNRFFHVLPVLLLFASCHQPVDRATLRKDTFEPYADLISGQVPDHRNDLYLEAMAHYSAARYAEAAAILERYISERKNHPKSAYLYLAMCHLANGRPYDAELAIDKLEQSNVKDFSDQCAWYTVVCWVCSEQWARALDGAKAIAASGRHTYMKQAEVLVDRLERVGEP